MADEINRMMLENAKKDPETIRKPAMDQQAKAIALVEAMPRHAQKDRLLKSMRDMQKVFETCDHRFLLSFYEHVILKMNP